MKALFITSVICALLSLLALFAVSAMTFTPGPGVESERRQMELASGAFFVGWLCVAFWARSRRHAASQPRWLSQPLVFIGVVYVLGVLLFVVG
jgi:hypothetical protein